LLLGLTGVGPLIAWRRASVSNLKRQFMWPTLFGVIVAAALFLGGMRSLAPLMTYGLSAFVAGTIIQEFYKGIRARQAIHNESVFTGFMHLVGRNRRRYGGYIVHAGIAMLFAAFAGMAFATQHDVTLATGQSFDVRDPYGHSWRFVSQGVSTSVPRDRQVQAVGLETFRDGKRLGIIASEKRQYLDTQGGALFTPITEVGIRTTAKLDTYVVLAGVRSNDIAELRISFNPLVVWVWIGGFVMMIGGLIVMWPQAEKRRPQAGYAAVLPTRTESAELAGV
jgi:cytochrome c-type biogenesis protein CcmF